MTGKLVLQADNRRESGYKPVFIGSNYHTKLKNLSSSTGLSMRVLTEKMLELAFDNLEIEVSEDGHLPE